MEVGGGYRGSSGIQEGLLGPSKGQPRRGGEGKGQTVTASDGQLLHLCVSSHCLEGSFIMYVHYTGVMVGTFLY